MANEPPCVVVVNQCFVVLAGGAISSAVAVRKCQSNRVQPPSSSSLRGAVGESAVGILPLEIANSPPRLSEICRRLRVFNGIIALIVAGALLPPFPCVICSASHLGVFNFSVSPACSLARMHGSQIVLHFVVNSQTYYFNLYWRILDRYLKMEFP